MPTEEQTFDWLHPVNYITEAEFDALMGESGGVPDISTWLEEWGGRWPSKHEFRIHEWSDPFTEYVQGLITGGTGSMASHLQGVYGQWLPVVTEEEDGEPEPGEPTPEEVEAWEERYGTPYPPYQAFGAEYPVTDLPIYEPFPQPYPELKLPIYEQFPVEYPELPVLYGEAEDVISRMLTGEGLGLPVEELMAAYTEEERLAMEEYIPQLREYWGEKGLLRSGMEREAEREVTRTAASARGTYRAQLEKESVMRQQDGIVIGLNLAMQHVGIGSTQQRYAWQAAMNEYTKVYESRIMAGKAHYGAATDAWDAMMTEYTKNFSSQVANTEFGQRIQEASFAVARDEYHRVFESTTDAWDAAYNEFNTFRRMLFDWATMEAGYDFQFEFQQRGFNFQFEFQQIQNDFLKMMAEMKHDFDMELQAAGYSAQQRQSLWNTFLNVAGYAILGWLFP